LKIPGFGKFTQKNRMSPLALIQSLGSQATTLNRNSCIKIITMIGEANTKGDVKQKILKKSTLKHDSNSWVSAQHHSAP